MSFDWDGYWKDQFRFDGVGDFLWALTAPGQFDRFYNHAHGDTRRYLAEVPFYGWYRRLRDEAAKADDYYRNTGEDPLYMSRYGGSAGSVGGAFAAAAKIPRMAKSLVDLYPAEVRENLMLRNQGYRLSKEAARAWESAWREKNGRE